MHDGDKKLFWPKKKKLKTKPSTKQQTQQELSTFASTFRHAQKQTFTKVRSPYSVAPSFPEVSRWGNWKSKILNLLALHVVLAGKVSIEGGGGGCMLLLSLLSVYFV